MRAFTISQFSYYTLVGMFHGKNSKNRVNRLQEKALRVVCDNSPYLSFDELIIKVKIS